METLALLGILLAIIAPISWAWANAIDQTTDEYNEHKDDPDYWDWL